MANKPKIQIPWALETDEVGERLRASHTLSYWMFSQSWNGRAPSVTVIEAIEGINIILNGSAETKLLHRLAKGMRDNIVNHGSKTCMSRHNKKYAVNENTEQARLVLL